jgi:lipopolysaccharide transport system permease protein
MSEPTEGTPPLRVIEASRVLPFDLRELWDFRELLVFLVWRDVKVRYKQTALGVAWVVLQPVASLAIFSLLFGRLAGMAPDGVPYPAFVFAGLLPWTFFSSALIGAAGSLVEEEKLISKVYFPRIFIPLVPVGRGLVDLVPGLVVFGALLLHSGIQLSGAALWLLPLVLLTGVTAFAVGLGLAALNVAYRDFRYTVPFLVQVWFFASPVIYPIEVVPQEHRWLLALNPMTGIIEGVRAAVLGRPVDPDVLLLSAAVSALLLVCALAYFRRVERRLADVI